MQESTVLLGLLGRALFSVEADFTLEEVNWERVFREARAQTVDLLIFDTLSEQERAVIPKDIVAAWQRTAFQRLQHSEKLRYEQAGLLRVLQDAEISCAVLKGDTAAKNYPNPSLRCAGDIDLLVGASDIEQARMLLEQRGYSVEEEAHSFHLRMRNGWHVVELHWEPASIPQGDVGERLRAFYHNVEKRAEYYDGIPQLPVNEQAVLLLLHKLEHITTSGLGLRQICDWARFVHKQLTAEAWERLEPLLQKFGLLRFTKIITRLCVDWLCLPAEDAPWCMDADPLVAAQLLEDILCAGNFGKKENRYGQRLFTDGNSGNRLTSFFRVGIRTCRSHWPVCERYPILLPVAPFVLGYRYHKKHKAGKKPELNVVKVYRGAKERQLLYTELKPFVVEKTT